MRSGLGLTSSKIGLCAALIALAALPFSLATRNFADDEPNPIAFNRTDLEVKGLGPRGIVAEDLNDDGFIDLVVANLGTYQVYQSQTLDVFFGRGDGTFDLVQTVPVGEGNEPYGIAAADLRGNGLTDVIVPNKAGRCVSVFLGREDGTFEDPKSYPTGDAWAVASGDLDGDGIIDLAVGDFEHQAMYLLPGIGDGGFHRAVETILPAGLKPRDFGLGDLDGDGRSDLVIPSDTPNGRLAIYMNHSSIGFFSLSGPQIIRVGSGTGAVAIHDLDGDGRLDVVASSQDSDSISVLIGRGDGTFELPVNYWATSIWPFSLSLADLDQDGNPDLVVSGVRGNRVEVLPGDGRGHFGEPVGVPIEGPCRWIETADFDNDGKIDIAAGNYTLSGGIETDPGMFLKTVSILLNRSGKFSSNKTAFRVNCGGGRYLNTRGFEYEGDSGFEGGQVVTTASSIANTPDQDLYRTARTGDFTYTARVTPGRSYTVALHFAETEIKKPGKRLFNISINGDRLWTRFDIVAHAGRNTARTICFRRIWPDKDGDIRVQFTTVKRGALCSAISVF